MTELIGRYVRTDKKNGYPRYACDTNSELSRYGKIVDVYNATEQMYMISFEHLRKDPPIAIRQIRDFVVLTEEEYIAETSRVKALKAIREEG